MMIKMKERILVTGARGCLGANLIKKLVKKGYQVNALIHSNKEHPFLINLKIKRFKGDVLDKTSLRKAMKGCKYVFHTAGIVSYYKKDFDKLMKVHVEGTRNVLEVAKELKVKKLVYTSSSAVIGYTKNKKKPLNEKTNAKGRYTKIGYVLTKTLAEKEVIKFTKESLNAVIVNRSSFYGAGDINMNQEGTAKNISKGILRLAPPGGCSVAGVNDIVEGHFLAMKKGRKGQRYLLSNENLEFVEAFNTVAQILNKKKIKLVLPRYIFPVVYCLAYFTEAIATLFGLNSFYAEAVALGFRYRFFDSSKARKELGWKPKQSFKQAMNEAIKFYKENNLLI